MVYRRTPLIAKLEELRDAARRTTVPPAGAGPMLFPNTNAAYGLDDIRVHDLMADDRHVFPPRHRGLLDDVQLLRLAQDLAHRYSTLNVRYPTQDPGTPPPIQRADAHPPLGRRQDLREQALLRGFTPRNVIFEFRVESSSQIPSHEGWAHTALLDGWARVEQQRGDYFNPRPDNAPLAVTHHVRRADLVSLHVSAPRWSLVVSSIPWWPGWKVVRNGKRIDPIRVTGTVLGFAVPPGENDVQVVYVPWTWRAGLGLAFVGAIVLIGSFTRSRAQTRDL
jgi:hypothetical protein